ncbi:MAG: Fe(3+) ABC transporter substrate-binding protein [Bacteroidota bacterium]
MKKIARIIAAVAVLLCSCKKKAKDEAKIQEVNVYTHRHYPPDQELFAQFEQHTGIKVNVVNASADELIQKMQLEGPTSPADVLITVDAGRLVRAKEKELLQSIESPFLDSIIAPHLKDEEKQWFALTKRARVIAYAKDRIDPEQLSTYEDLASDTWKAKLLIRSSSNIYNQSLMASLIANLGEEKSKEWAQKIVENMARDPKGNDRDQVKAVVAGEGDLAIVNTYYIGRMINSEDAVEANAGKGVGIYFPNQNDRGTHMNISGAGVAKYAPNRENAIRFIEFLASGEAQLVFAEANYEYPVNQNVDPAPLLQSWGSFKEDQLNLSELGTNNKAAVLLFDDVGWQ